MRFILAFVAIGMLVFGTSAVAAPCDTTGQGTGVHPVGPVYIEHRGTAAFWIYQETNDYTGLQHGGCSIALYFDCDPCNDTPSQLASDRLIL